MNSQRPAALADMFNIMAVRDDGVGTLGSAECLRFSRNPFSRR